MDHLLCADSNNCAQLKEAVLNFILDNKKVDVLNMVLLKDIPRGLFANLLVAIARGEDISGDVTSSENQFTTMMHISKFCWRAHGK